MESFTFSVKAILCFEFSWHMEHSFIRLPAIECMYVAKAYWYLRYRLVFKRETKRLIHIHTHTCVMCTCIAIWPMFVVVAVVICLRAKIWTYLLHSFVNVVMFHFNCSMFMLASSLQFNWFGAWKSASFALSLFISDSIQVLCVSHWVKSWISDQIAALNERNSETQRCDAIVYKR